MKQQSHLARLKMLELSQARDGAAQISKWGESVTDDELRHVANAERLPSRVTAIRRPHPGAYSDSELYLIVKPFIDDLRAKVRT